MTELPKLSMKDLSNRAAPPAAVPEPAEARPPARSSASAEPTAGGSPGSSSPDVEPGSGQRGDGDAAPLPAPADLILVQLEQGDRGQRRTFRWTLFWAVLVHAIILFVSLPEATTETLHVGRPAKVYVMEQVRFKKPPAKAARPQQEVPKKRAKKIPIPDPTPDEPEPVEVEPVEYPELEPSELAEVSFGIPEAPGPGPGLRGPRNFQGSAMQLGSGVARPVAISKPQPRYTEVARQKRIQGVVILTGIVDAEGNVRNLEVVKGLPFGLDASALETVQSWKFRPATLGGEPVAVYYHFQVSFALQ